MNKTKVRDALQALNANYGRGKIAKISWRNKSGIRKLQYGTAKFRFKVIKNTVLAFGHQMKLTSKKLKRNPDWTMHRSRSTGRFTANKKPKWIKLIRAREANGKKRRNRK